MQKFYANGIILNCQDTWKFSYVTVLLGSISSSSNGSFLMLGIGK